MRPLYVALITAALLWVPPASAHHSNSIFDLTSTVNLQGTVSRYVWANPHIYVYVEVTDDTGSVVEWLIEADPTPMMTRNGWSPTTLNPGDPVSVRANPDRNSERPHAILLSLVKSDGVLLTRRSNGRASSVGATGLAGVWDALGGFSTRTINTGTPTTSGAAAQAVYVEADNPVSVCVPYASPNIARAPYLNEIDIQGDTIFIRSEFFNVERTIYLDGRGHPENGERTNQGHSIGTWEGDVLVVDTTLFTDDRTGNGRGIPSGPQKHAVERYELSEDGRRLLIEYVIEDPEYLLSPTTGNNFWDYAPDREMLPFPCDPQNAALYGLG